MNKLDNLKLKIGFFCIAFGLIIPILSMLGVGMSLEYRSGENAIVFLGLCVIAGVMLINSVNK